MSQQSYIYEPRRYMVLLGIKRCTNAQTSSHSNNSVNIKSEMSSFPFWFLLRVSDIKSETMAFMSGAVFRQIYSECQRASIKIWWVLTTELIVSPVLNPHSLHGVFSLKKKILSEIMTGEHYSEGGIWREFVSV